jgi:hypothetical protein
VKGNDVQDEARITVTSKRLTESLSWIMIDYLNPKGESVLSAEAELRRDTLPWTITIKTETSEGYSAQDATAVWQSSWILSEILEELTAICFEMVNESESYSEEK